MKRIIKSKRMMLLSVTILLSMCLGLTYGAFIIGTDKYTSSELIISELTYGIKITEDGSSGSEINDNIVTVPKETKGYFYVTVTSANDIESRYTLAYKTSSNAIVEYTDRTPWISYGYIEEYGSESYTKRIRIVIDNEKGTENAEVRFKVYGGYAFNDYVSIDLGDYISVRGPYKEVVASLSSRLVDIVEKESECVTKTKGRCMYSGGSLNNYLQYPESEDKSENIWRIIGTYQIGNEVVAKIIREEKGTTTVSNISSSLTSFYKTLENTENIIYKTNKFNCNTNSCEETTYEDIGLITTEEYKKVGGNESYLVATNPYFAIENNNIKNIKQTGIEETTNETTSGLRPSVYLQTDVKVAGSGTITDPYVITDRSDINLVAYTLKGETPESSQTFSWLLENKIVDTVTCKNDTKASWNYNNNSLTLTELHVPDYCTIDFKDGYTVTLTAENGKVQAPQSKVTYEKGTLEFIVTPNSDFKSDNLALTCDGGANITSEPSGENVKVKVSNVTSTQTCNIKFKGYTALEIFTKKYTSAKKREDDNAPYDSIVTEGKVYYEDGVYTEGGSKVYYFAGNTKENWLKFGTNTNGQELWWRIIRTNEDGGLRLLYAGTGPDKQDAYIEQMSYNTKKNHPTYVGYMYSEGDTLAEIRGNEIPSPIKTELETWYTNNLESKYDKYVSKTAIYCNDRSTQTEWKNSGAMDYNARTKFFTNKTNNSKNHPSFKCGVDGSGNLNDDPNDPSSADEERKKDMFSVSKSSGGNGDLDKPIALMTADEIVFAGSPYESRNSYAYYFINETGSNSIDIGKSWWTMTPSIVRELDKYSYVMTLGGAEVSNMYLGNLYTAVSETAVRPVISLKSCVQLSGSGTSGDPYEVVEIGDSDSCATAVN